MGHLPAANSAGQMGKQGHLCYTERPLQAPSWLRGPAHCAQPSKGWQQDPRRTHWAREPEWGTSKGTPGHHIPAESTDAAVLV